MIEDVVRTQHARLGEFRPELGEVADELGQDAHVELARDLPPVEVELAEQADADQTVALVPVAGETLQVARQMRGGRLFIHRRADHVQRADAGIVERVQRRIGMLGASRRMAGVDDGGDAGVERGDRRQLGAQIHVERAIMRAQRLGDDVDIGEEIVDIGHHAPHHAEPHMMMGVDQARHDDAAGGVDDFGVVGHEIRPDGDDAVALDEDVADREIGNFLIHRDDGAALEEGAAFCCVLMIQILLLVRDWGAPVIARPES